MSTDFFKSTFSGGDKTCVEVAFRSEHVLIRDSKYPDSSSPIITVPVEQWPAVLDLAVSLSTGTVAGNVAITAHDDGTAVVSDHGVALTYTAEEWEAFTKGITAGEFDLPGKSS
ncbi:DUF397 domain-containing protein [Nocardia pseudovaccinii]|uniref:DUF397 domain-containing protein n=1 Tax=Nocardia pseudovaccinii TaxID=189540 RepID=UPI003D914C9F